MKKEIINIDEINNNLIKKLSLEVNIYFELNFIERLNYKFENNLLNILKNKNLKDIKIFEGLSKENTLTGEEMGLNSQEKVINNIKKNVSEYFLKNKMYDNVLNNIKYYSSEELIKLFKETPDKVVLESLKEFSKSDIYKNNIRYQKVKDNIELIVGVLIIKRPNIKNDILEIFPRVEEKKLTSNKMKK